MNTPNILVTLHLDHSYYLSPCPQDLLRIAQLPSGVFAQTRREEVLIYSRLDTDVSFPLLISFVPRDTEFVNFTDMPDDYEQLSKRANVWVLNSQNADKEGNIQAKDCQFVPVYPQYFQYPLPEGKRLKEVELTPFSGTKRKALISGNQDQSFFQFDLRNFTPNLFNAKFTFADNTIATHSFVASDQYSQHPPFAIWLQQAPPVDLGGLFENSDLQIFEGIGKTEEQLLDTHNIKTWSDIAATSPQLITAYLQAHHHDETIQSLPEQARFAVSEKWEELVHLQQELYVKTHSVGEQKIPAKVLIKAREAKKSKKNEPPHGQQSAVASEIPSPKIPNYTIRFEARATLWRYVFIGLTKAAWEKSTLEFSGGDLPIIPQFTHDPEPLALPNGQTGLSMTSTHPIPLQQQPVYQIQLKSPGFSSPMPLPFPQPTILKRKNGSLSEENVTYVSEIFVQL